MGEDEGSCISAYCPFGLGLCNHGGPSCGKKFENTQQCLEYTRRLIDEMDKSNVQVKWKDKPGINIGVFPCDVCNNSHPIAEVLFRRDDIRIRYFCPEDEEGNNHYRIYKIQSTARGG